jgi:starch-binding outer membrane protein, SusD/RagB family
MLLANLYLNAEVYTGTAKNTEAATYAKKVMDVTGYSLETKYANLFLADNHKSNEIIFAVNFDGNNTRTYGGTTFLVHAAVGGSMSPALYGIDGGWGGLRTTAALVDKFNDTADKRAIFHTAGQTKAIADIGEFTNGYAVGKYKNVTSTGATGSNLTFVDTDFPIFRLAEAYLIYAEAVKRGGTGDATLALNKLVALRTRAGITASLPSYDLNYIIDERARELYWEGHRRTDLIRFGLFTSGTYVWPWKGNTINGQAVDSWRALFPIPSADINANPNLVQNTGY